MEEKVKQLEKVLHAMTRKVLSLEKEIIEIKKNYKVIEVLENKPAAQALGSDPS